MPRQPRAWCLGRHLAVRHPGKSISGTEDHTTNNRMELQAAIEGLQAIKKHAQVHLTTDSQYVKNGITQWIKGWLHHRRGGWGCSKNAFLCR